MSYNSSSNETAAQWSGNPAWGEGRRAHGGEEGVEDVIELALGWLPAGNGGGWGQGSSRRQ